MVLADSAVGVWKRTIMSGRKENEKMYLWAPQHNSLHGPMSRTANL